MCFLWTHDSGRAFDALSPDSGDPVQDEALRQAMIRLLEEKC